MIPTSGKMSAEHTLYKSCEASRPAMAVLTMKPEVRHKMMTVMTTIVSADEWR